MLTAEQNKWVAHLDNKKKVGIFPYNPKTKEVFKKIEEEIKRLLKNIEILHCGSTALEILGQGEIDLYIPVIKKDFENYLGKLTEHFGEPGSVYPLRRARFVRHIDDIKIEIFLMNKETEDWINHIKFESYLKQNKKALEEYIKIKQESDGLTVQEYYIKKLEFINKILSNAQGKISRSHNF